MIIVASAGVELVPTLGSNFRREVDQHGRRAGEQFGSSFNRGADGRMRNTVGGRFGQRATADAGKVGSRAGRSFGQRFKSSITTIGLGLGTALAAGIGSFAVISAKSLARIERINAQTVTAIESTGGAARVSAKHVEDLAGALENLTATEAESIQQGANFLLTFTNIRNGVGKSNQIFDRTVRAMTDMSRAMDKTGGVVLDTRTQALQLGKALNDPVKGITALQRVGVSFTEGQKKQIKALVDSGKTMKAQKLILRELEKEFGGSGEAFAKTTTGRIELAKHAIGTFGEAIMEETLPAIARLADKGTKGINILTEHAPEIRDFGRDVLDLAKTVGQELVPHLKTAGEVVVGTVKFFAGLPGPVKEFGAQALIAAVILPKVSAGILAVRGATLAASASMVTFGQRLAQNRAAMSYQNTIMGKAREAVAGFGGVARQVAGVGGIVLLTQGMQQSNTTAKAFMTTMGGIATGLALGGPVGAVIGGIAGLFIGLKDHITGAKQATKLLNQEAARNAGLLQWREALEKVRDTLDQMNGAATQTTRQWALERLQAEEVLASYEDLGISQRTAVSAVLGNKKALAELNAAVGHTDPVIAMLNEEFREQQAATRDAADATASLADRLGLTSVELKKVPRKVRIAIQDDVPDSLAEIKALGAQVKGLDKRTIRILLKAADLPATRASIDKVKKDIESVGSVKIKPQWKNKFTSDLGGLRTDVKKTGKNAGRDLNAAVADSVKTTSGLWTKPFKSKLRDGGGAKPDAAAGGKGVGLNLAVGTALGVLSGIPSVTAAAITMARAAEQAAKNELDIHSPSRKFFGIGANTVLGFVRGINLNTGSVGKSISRMMAAINAAVKKHDISKTMAAQARGIVNNIAGEAAKLRNLIAARNELAKSITSGLRTDFDLSAIVGKNEFGISQGPAQAVQAAQAIVARMKGFAEKLLKLTKAGLPGALVQEIAGYGSVEGSRVADVLLQASKSQLGSIRTSFAQFQQYANLAGMTAANATYGGRIEAQQDKLEAAIERGLARMGLQVDVGIGRATSVRIYQQGKAAADARR